jgi:hypothetical protein
MQFRQACAETIWEAAKTETILAKNSIFFMSGTPRIAFHDLS